MIDAFLEEEKDFDFEGYNRGHFDSFKDFGELYSDTLPKFREAKKMYKEAKIYMNLPERSVDGPVAYISEKTGYSRRTIRRVKNSSVNLASIVNAYDRLGEPAELGSEPIELGSLIKVDILKDYVSGYLNDPVINYQVELEYEDSNPAETLSGIDAMLYNQEITPFEAQKKREETERGIKAQIRNRFFYDAIKSLPAEAQLIAGVVYDEIEGTSDMKDFENRYFSLAQGIVGNPEELSQLTGLSASYLPKKMRQLDGYFCPN